MSRTPTLMKQNAGNEVSLVISVCEIRDMDVWKLAAPRVVRNIPAENYQLICPDFQIPDFRAVMGDRWKLKGESDFAENCAVGVIREKVVGRNLQRVHWLYQQFLKINAILLSGLGDDAVVLIWDADTIPLKRMDFRRSDSPALFCYSGKERHLPYFDTINELFGFGAATDRSFIAQCLPVRVGWVREMVAEIEAAFSMPYVEAVLKLLPGESGSEFSEYETIGTWVFRRRPGELCFGKRNRWLRSGPRLFGRDLSGVRARFCLWLLSGWFDFVAIEKWDRPLDFGRLRAVLARRIKRR